MTKLNKKLSLKVIGLDKEVIQDLVFSDKNKSHELAIFYGTMTKFKKGETIDPNGEVRQFTGLRGMFKGVNQLTGQTLSASVCYLPNVAIDLLEGQYSEGDRISFAVIISASYDKTSATSYVYEAEFMAQEQEDPFAMLENKIKSERPTLSLPAPDKKDEKPSKKAGK